MADSARSGVGRAAFVTGLALPGVFLLSGCGDKVPEVSPEDGAIVVEIAEPAAGQLLRTLVSRVTAAVEEGGTAHAVDYCSMDAIPLTRLVEAGLEGDLTLKRTSFRYRNPANAPDEAEEMALRYFEDAILADGRAPAHYVQRVSPEELRYYQPLFVGEFCLQCHGDPDAMTPETRSKLAAKYPGDLATGYEAGDFRGLVRVSVPASMVQMP